ncbi:MAG: PAS domain-containing protein [Sphingomonadales bacterium]|nr:PAS domain-containing protein [Sphingomonadales bacterium]MBD3772174.1 PAS domain-containing protein [Paracoccaceae bacterium]
MTARSAPPSPVAQIGGLIFAVVLVDPEMRIAQANPAAEHLLGQSARRLSGEDLFEVIDIDDPRVLERTLESDAQIVARGISMRVEGRSKRVNMTVSPLVTHPGWKVVTFSDVGQEELADERERTVSLRAPAVLAHEIKNPLAAIRGAGQLLARKLPDADRALAQVISDEVDRIASLIDRMQKLGSQVPEPVAPFNLHEAIRQALTTVRTAGNEDVPLVEEFDPSLPAVLGNREAFEQVMINLLSNARDACSKEENPIVVVKTRFVSGFAFNAIRLGRSIRLPIEITVTDNGRGIDPALQDHVFEPFVSSKKNGQGLGLALVKKLVRDMDGRISHERDERAGLTHFRIHLPVAK